LAITYLTPAVGSLSWRGLSRGVRGAVKAMAKMLAFLTENTSNYAENLIITSFFKKKRRK
jgi:hypothetical protein